MWTGTDAVLMIWLLFPCLYERWPLRLWMCFSFWYSSCLVNPAEADVLCKCLLSYVCTTWFITVLEHANLHVCLCCCLCSQRYVHGKPRNETGCRKGQRNCTSTPQQGNDHTTFEQWIWAMQIKSNKLAFVWNNKQLYSYFEDIF